MKPVKFCLLGAVLTMAFLMRSQDLTAQLRKDLENEINVFIVRDSLDFPAQETNSLRHTSLTIRSKRIRDVFDRFNVESIARGIPNFVDQDTVKIVDGGRSVRVPDLSRIFRVRLQRKEDVDLVISELSKIPGVAYAEKNVDAHLFSDPDSAKQWHLKNTGQSGGTYGADIKADQAWQIFTGSSTAKIGIIDTGVETAHEDLSGKATGDSPDGNDFHGTHVAGIAAAKANNGKGGRGVDWNAQIISRRIFSQGYYDGDATASSKIHSAVDAGAKVLNHSWGWNGTLLAPSTTIRLAFAYAYKMNCVSVVAMGNAGSNQLTYPAAMGQGVIAVGASTDNDVKSSFSNYNSYIDVVAPGGINPYPNNDQHDIWSSWGNNSYRYLAGTSMATPVVTGLASLLKGYNTILYNDDIEHIIQLSADDVNSTQYPGWDQYMGYGRVNAKRALDLLTGTSSIYHNMIVGGTTITLNPPSYGMQFYGVSGLTDGYTYMVKQYEVQRSVTFPYRISPSVWGDGYASIGFSTGNPNYGMNWCDVVPGSVTNTGATLRTYVYDVDDGVTHRWFPTDASHVTYTFSVLGTYPPVTVSLTANPSQAPSKGSLVTLTASASGGTGYYSFSWVGASPSGGGSGNGPTATTNVTICGQGVTVTATSGSQTATATINLTYVGCAGGCDEDGNPGGPYPCKKLIRSETQKLPDKFELSQNYPNPFNPTTTIKFAIPIASNVILKIYNIQGQEVKTLVGDYLSEGFYEAEWDGKDEAGSQVASGIYVYRIQAGNFVQSKKLTFIK